MRNDIPSSRDEAGGIVGGELWGILAARGSVRLVLARGEVEDHRVPCTLLKWGWRCSIEVGVGCISWNKWLFSLLWLRKLLVEGDMHDAEKPSLGCELYMSPLHHTHVHSGPQPLYGGGYGRFVYI